MKPFDNDLSSGLSRRDLMRSATAIAAMIPDFIDNFIHTTESGCADRGLGRNAFSFNGDNPDV